MRILFQGHGGTGHWQHKPNLQIRDGPRRKLNVNLPQRAHWYASCCFTFQDISLLRMLGREALAHRTLLLESCRVHVITHGLLLGYITRTTLCFSLFVFKLLSGPIIIPNETRGKGNKVIICCNLPMYKLLGYPGFWVETLEYHFSPTTSCCSHVLQAIGH